MNELGSPALLPYQLLERGIAIASQFGIRPDIYAVFGQAHRTEEGQDPDKICRACAVGFMLLGAGIDPTQFWNDVQAKRVAWYASDHDEDSVNDTDEAEKLLLAVCPTFDHVTYENFWMTYDHLARTETPQGALDIILADLKLAEVQA